MASAERAVASLVRSAEDPTRLRAELAHFLWTGEGPFPAVLREDPHALGWLHQYLGEPLRHAAFRAHTTREQKHASATATTQLYTPRWIADWLVEQSIAAAGFSGHVLDPACGGGQMLLAAADALITRGWRAADAFAALHGIDLDPDAVWTCRESLKLAAARALGARDTNLEATIDAQIRVGDGLRDGAPATLVITNPPYMGARSMPPAMRAELARFAPFHHDLYLAFTQRCVELSTDTVAILAPQTVWYLKRFEAARRELLGQGNLTHFAHFGHGVFEALSGEKATVVGFVWRSGATGELTRFWDLREGNDKRAGLAQPPLVLDTRVFAALPGGPLAFWLPQPLFDAFGAEEATAGETRGLAPRTRGQPPAPTRRRALRVGDVFDVPGSQNKTGDNARFVRPIAQAPPDWIPYSKGGKFAPWWGNWDWAVDWSEQARGFYASNRTSNLLDERYWFREGLCYSDFGGKHFNARWMPPGCVFDMAGPAIFAPHDDRELLAALLVLLNSTVVREILNALNPTLHYQVRDVRNVPLPRWDDATVANLAPLGHALVQATRDALQRGAPAPLDLEEEADALVAQLYGCPELCAPRALRRVHHLLRTAP